MNEDSQGTCRSDGNGQPMQKITGFIRGFPWYMRLLLNRRRSLSDEFSKRTCGKVGTSSKAKWSGSWLNMRFAVELGVT
jgi:hypothetical protein